MTAVGLCGSDLHWYEDGAIGDARLIRPLVLGHEFAGIIVGGSRDGERVAADPANPCGSCRPCTTGRGRLCPAVRFAGHGETDGALRTRMAWPSRLCHAIPPSISDAEAVLLEPLGVALHGVDLGTVSRGMRAGVYGCGPVGLLVVSALRAAGIDEIIATDPLPHRVAAAAERGASEVVVVPRDGSADPAAGMEVDVAFECSGEDAALATAISAAEPGGRVVLIGIPAGDQTSFAAGTARRKELELVLCRRMEGSDLPRAVRLVGSGEVSLARLVTHRYPLDQAATAFEALAQRRGIKIVVEPLS